MPINFQVCFIYAQNKQKKFYAVGEKTLIDTKYGDTLDMWCSKRYNGCEEIEENHIVNGILDRVVGLQKPYGPQFSYVLNRIDFNQKKETLFVLLLIKH